MVVHLKHKCIPFQGPLPSFHFTTVSLKTPADASVQTLPTWARGLRFACHPGFWTCLLLSIWSVCPFTESVSGSCSLSSQVSVRSSYDPRIMGVTRALLTMVFRGNEGGRNERMGGRWRSVWASRMHSVRACPILIQIKRSKGSYGWLCLCGLERFLKCDCFP